MKINNAHENLYWQHQQQLQPCALTFNALLTHQKSTGSNKESAQTNPPVTQTSPQTGTPRFIGKRYIDTLAHDMPTPLPTIIQHPLADYHNPVHATYCSAAFKAELLNYFSKKTPCITPNAPKRLMKSSLQHYQLTCNGNNIELALNASHLTKKEIQALTTHLRQWFATKGYCLKQFIINGVTQ